MTAHRMPACLQALIAREFETEFPRQFELLSFARSGVVGVQFWEELHYPYENLGLSSAIFVVWRGQARAIPAPELTDPETGRPWASPYTYAATYEERVAAAIEGIRRLEADYQRKLNDYDRSR